MRDFFRRSLVVHADEPDFVFLTGDLGFGVLEPLQVAMGSRFINAGVAEQNMVGVAAGMAKEGIFPWVYSIAPFIYARAFEQIRNDIANHGLPVVLVGNGGGYGYGVMGGTHHALEDYGVLSTLPNLEIYVPCFARDVDDIVSGLFERKRAAYVRLGRCEGAPDAGVARFAPWRRLVCGTQGALVSIGPLAGGIAQAVNLLPEQKRPSLWVAGTLPVTATLLPHQLLQDIEIGGVSIVEEHVGPGGLGASLSLALMNLGIKPLNFSHRFAQRYPSARYGSQSFHRRESGLDAEAVLRAYEVGPS